MGDWLELDVADVLLGVSTQKGAWISLFQDEFVAVVPEDAFPGKRSIILEDLYPYPFIVTQNLSPLQHIDISRFQETIVINAEDDMSAVSLVQEGMGVTILPSLVLKKRKHGIRMLKLKPSISRTLVLCYKQNILPNSGAHRFVEYITDVFCQEGKRPLRL